MHKLKAEAALYHNSEYGICITADTLLSMDIPMDEAVKTIANIFTKAIWLPSTIKTTSALTAYRYNLPTDIGIYGRDVVQASQWILTHMDDVVILAIQSIYINPSTKTWFVTYWTLPNMWHI